MADDRFTGKAVKSVALKAVRLQFPVDWQDARDIGHVGMESRVETGGLRNTWKMRPCEPDARQCGWRVKRRERACGLELP